MRRLRVESEQSVHTFPLPPAGRLRLGAAGDNDVILTVAGVSRRHAELTVGEDGARLVDLGSKNRLIVGNERRDEVLLAPGVSVRIGTAEVSLEEVSTADCELALSLDDSSSAAAFSSGSTDTTDSLEPSGSPREALALVRRFERAPLADERGLLLSRARQILDAATLLRFQVALGDSDPDDLVIEDIAGPLPPPEVRVELRCLPQAAEPESRSLESGPECLWSGPGQLAESSPPAARSILAALYQTTPWDEHPPGWMIDFLAYVAGRLAREEPTATAAERRRPPADELVVPPGMVLGSAPAMQEILEEIRACLVSRHDLLLYGETGTGKELFARLLHRSGPSANGPFVAVNCAAIPAELLEAELFGVEKRVATGVDPRPGRFRQANGGTLLLDEIADLPTPLQPKLLRALQEREALPLGAARPVKFDVRVISTSSCQLPQRVGDGTFRADLYYRLDRLRLNIPPLRERLEDLPLLAGTFARRTAAEQGVRIRGLSVRALEMLEAHPWPGNVRELEAALTRAVMRCRGGVLESQHFHDLRPLQARGPASPETSEPRHTSRPAPGDGPAPDAHHPPPLKQRLEAEERRALSEALAATGGNRSQAAKLLQISRQGLIDKLRRLGLDGKDGSRPRLQPGGTPEN